MNEQTFPAVGGPVDAPVGRQVPERCKAGKDGECADPRCPQLRDGEPAKTSQHCPLDHDETDEDAWAWEEAEEWPDEPVCDHCGGDGMDPDCDRLLPCPACQGEQRP